jgi:hypothetical protein
MADRRVFQDPFDRLLDEIGNPPIGSRPSVFEHVRQMVLPKDAVAV